MLVPLFQVRNAEKSGYFKYVKASFYRKRLMDHLIVVDVPNLLCFSHVDCLKDGCSDTEFNIQNAHKGRKVRMVGKGTGIERA